jgi:replication-associated recombination protein RarA
MMPRTIHKGDPNGCISAMQKMIRRGLEKEAMEFAVELGHTSKSFATWVTNRLLIISYEDVGLAEPSIIPLVKTCCEQAKAWYADGRVAEWRMAVGTAIRAMCRVPKSREGDHFQAAVGIRSEVEGFAPTVPEWCFDKHTAQGRRLGRGFDHFRQVGTVLVPPPATKDPYEDEAYRLWMLADGQKKAAKEAEHEDAKAAKGTNAMLF